MDEDLTSLPEELYNNLLEHAINILMICEAQAWVETFVVTQNNLDEDFLESMVLLPLHMVIDTASSEYRVRRAANEMKLECKSNHVAWAFLIVYTNDPYILTTLDSRFDSSFDQTRYLVEALSEVAKQPQKAISSMGSETFRLELKQKVAQVVQRVKDMIDEDEALQKYDTFSYSNTPDRHAQETLTSLVPSSH